jgi:GNAT superfamily N-acetyltransferase
MTMVRQFTCRIATSDDLPELNAVADAAIAVLQQPFLTAEQIDASRAIMGIDTRLIDDGTYFAVEAGGRIAGCGGWSWRTSLFGGNHTAGRDDTPLDPAVDAARIRAMYTHPDFARRGVGQLVLTTCERAAATAGFRRLELIATLAGLPLYTTYGFAPVEHLVDRSTGTPIPIVRMVKPIDHDSRSV